MVLENELQQSSQDWTLFWTKEGWSTASRVLVEYTCWYTCSNGRDCWWWWLLTGIPLELVPLNSPTPKRSSAFGCTLVCCRI